MKLSILRRRPSPALVISIIALFVSLSGVSYGVATGFIDSREIKNNEIRSRDIRNSTVQGRDIALNTVTGEDISETTLGKVPSATAADAATSADAVDTLKIIPRTTLAEGATPVVLATHGPLTLRAQCESNGTATQAQLTLQTTEDNSAAWSEDVNFPVLDSGDGAQSFAFMNDLATAPRTIALRNLAGNAVARPSRRLREGRQSRASPPLPEGRTARAGE